MIKLSIYWDKLLRNGCMKSILASTVQVRNTNVLTFTYTQLVNVVVQHRILTPKPVLLFILFFKFTTYVFYWHKESKTLAITILAKTIFIMAAAGTCDVLSKQPKKIFFSKFLLTSLYTQTHTHTHAHTQT